MLGDRWRRRGLSPRARGSPARAVSIAVFCGSILAGAGKPRGHVPNGAYLRVYPRGRGEASTASRAIKWCRGLSPRARGSLSRLRLAGDLIGSIPAGAGKPQKSVSCWKSYQVYPRGRGEAIAEYSDDMNAWGLSPRARGSPAQRMRRNPRVRSIPAGAGKPIPVGGDHSADGVYPRGRGEARGARPSRRSVPAVPCVGSFQGRWQAAL